MGGGGDGGVDWGGVGTNLLNTVVNTGSSYLKKDRPVPARPAARPEKPDNTKTILKWVGIGVGAIALLLVIKSIFAGRKSA